MAEQVASAEEVVDKTAAEVNAVVTDFKCEICNVGFHSKRSLRAHEGVQIIFVLLGWSFLLT